MELTYDIRKNAGLAAVLAFLAALVAWLAAALYVFCNDGFGIGDLRAFAWWCVPLAVVAAPLVMAVDRLSRTWASVPAYLLSLVAAILLTAGMTVLARFALGPWIQAFSFPIVWCWLLGVAFALFGRVVLQRPRTWPAMLILLISLVVLPVAFARSGSPEHFAELTVSAVPSSSPTDFEALWHLFEVPPTPTPSGYNPEGIRTVSASDMPTSSRLLVTFHSGTKRAMMEAVARRAFASPLVGEVSLVEFEPTGERVSVLHLVKPTE
jgi:hypothetical protein